LLAAFQWLVKRDRWPHEALQNLSEAVQAGLQFKMVVGGALCDGGYDGNIISLGANSVRGGDNCKIDI
jgi:hypothetical protein